MVKTRSGPFVVPPAALRDEARVVGRGRDHAGERDARRDGRGPGPGGRRGGRRAVRDGRPELDLVGRRRAVRVDVPGDRRAAGRDRPDGRSGDRRRLHRRARREDEIGPVRRPLAILRDQARVVGRRRRQARDRDVDGHRAGSCTRPDRRRRRSVARGQAVLHAVARRRTVGRHVARDRRARRGDRADRAARDLGCKHRLVGADVGDAADDPRVALEVEHARRGVGDRRRPDRRRGVLLVDVGAAGKVDEQRVHGGLVVGAFGERADGRRRNLAGAEVREVDVSGGALGPETRRCR